MQLGAQYTQDVPEGGTARLCPGGVSCAPCRAFRGIWLLGMNGNVAEVPSCFVFPQVLHQTFPQHTFLMNGLIHGVKVRTPLPGFCFHL